MKNLGVLTVNLVKEADSDTVKATLVRHIKLFQEEYRQKYMLMETELQLSSNQGHFHMP